MSFDWTDEKIQCVKDLWGKQSANDIAGIIGHPSRSAVCGKAKRLGLAQPQLPSKRRGMWPKPTPQPEMKLRQIRIGERRLYPALPPAKPIVDAVPAAPDSSPCTLLDLSAERCRWPLWGQVVSDQYCGAKSIEGLPYCHHHSRLAYQRRASA